LQINSFSASYGEDSSLLQLDGHVMDSVKPALNLEKINLKKLSTFIHSILGDVV
jgi:hypothetical protein